MALRKKSGKDEVKVATAAAETAVVEKTHAQAPTLTKFAAALSDVENALEPVEFGTLPIVKANLGELHLEDEPLGKEIVVSIVSFNDRFAVSPNDNDAPNNLCKFSFDGEVCTDGTLVRDHLETLREEGWNKAAVKKYLDVIAILGNAEEETEEIGNIVVLSLSPQSVKAFTRYRLGVSVRIGNGELDPDQAKRVIVQAKNKTFGTNKFTCMAFKLAD